MDEGMERLLELKDMENFCKTMSSGHDWDAAPMNSLYSCLHKTIQMTPVDVPSRDGRTLLKALTLDEEPQAVNGC